MYKCKYCNKEFASVAKVASHTSHCSDNPKNVRVECSKCHRLFLYTKLNYHLKFCTESNRRNPIHQRGQGWAKGLTKDTSESIRKGLATKIKNNSQNNGWRGRHLSEAHKQKISISLTKFNHENNNRNLHSKGGWYNDIYFMSTWELAYYLYMIDHNVKITRCTDRYMYHFEDKFHYYTPDFVINDTTIVEIKGYEHSKDFAKYAAMKAANLDFVVLYEADLRDMINYVKTKYNVNKLSELYSVLNH